jgi:hypothetical protein
MVSLIDLALEQAINENGLDAYFVSRNTNIPIVKREKQERKKGHYTLKWTEEEDNFLRENLGWLTEDEIAAHLGRTVVAVHLRWKRDLLLPAPSRHPDVITAEQAANVLRVESHAFIWWCDNGLIQFRIMPGGRKIRIIQREAFKRWIVNPANWIYFDWKNIQDEKIKRLCELRAQRWGDERWTTRQVADHHGVDVKDVTRFIKLGRVKGVQCQVSKGGRHAERRWTYWFVLRSDALKLEFVRGQGSNTAWKPTPRQVKWMRKAFKMGWSYNAILRSMKSDITGTTLKNFITKKAK